MMVVLASSALVDLYGPRFSKTLPNELQPWVDYAPGPDTENRIGTPYDNFKVIFDVMMVLVASVLVDLYGPRLVGSVLVDLYGPRFSKTLPNELQSWVDFAPGPDTENRIGTKYDNFKVISDMMMVLVASVLVELYGPRFSKTLPNELQSWVD
jgi:hypothetical protein